MKLNKIFRLFGFASFLALTACEPIEERDELSNSFNPDDIELEVVQATPGGNKLSIQMNTEGVTGYWDYIIDKKFTDRVEVVFPFTGTHEFTFHVTTPYMTEDGVPESRVFVEKSVNVEITQLDEELPQAYYYLVGENLEGKIWVFDGGPAPDGGLWWYMSDPTNYAAVWWNAAGDCCPPADAAGRMKFDLDGGANYTYWSGPDAEPVTGSKFVFNADYSKLTIEGPANILGSMDGGGNNKVFDIIELSADKMILHVPNAAWNTGWTWIFVPAE